MQSEWITCKGQKILYINCANLDEHTLQAELDAVGKLMVQQPEGSVRTLTDVRGIVTSPVILGIFKDSTAKYKKYVFREAILGISGAKKTLLEIVSRFSGVSPTVFEDLEKAKEWLASE